MILSDSPTPRSSASVGSPAGASSLLLAAAEAQLRREGRALPPVIESGWTTTKRQIKGAVGWVLDQLGPIGDVVRAAVDALGEKVKILTSLVRDVVLLKVGNTARNAIRRGDTAERRRAIAAIFKDGEVADRAQTSKSRERVSEAETVEAPTSRASTAVVEPDLPASAVPVVSPTRTTTEGGATLRASVSSMEAEENILAQLESPQALVDAGVPDGRTPIALEGWRLSRDAKPRPRESERRLVPEGAARASLSAGRTQGFWDTLGVPQVTRLPEPRTSATQPATDPAAGLGAVEQEGAPDMPPRLGLRRMHGPGIIETTTSTAVVRG